MTAATDTDSASDTEQTPAIKSGNKAKDTGTDLRASKTGAYRSGFCGGTVIHNVYVTNSEVLHRMCRFGRGGMCTCRCHDGVAVWEGREDLEIAAKAGNAPASAQIVGANKKVRKRR